MSLMHNFIVNNPYFYPVGNTPAVCLTQNLPPDSDATLLLLGCGDIRNILFTAYAGAGTNGRKLDFTCCDLEDEILARNIIALTLIIDDKDGTSTLLLWNIYYHIFLDASSFSYLCAQANKLLSYGNSIEAWNNGPYGRLIRFCDSTTLQNVVKLWKLYAVDASQSVEHQHLQHKLKSTWERAKDFATREFGGGICLNVLRSTAPLLEKAMDASIGHKIFWKTGCITDDKKFLSKSRIANPMFVHSRPNKTLHYVTDPLLGFHLATAYVQLAADSPFHPDGVSKIWEIAQLQFEKWCTAFRGVVDNCTVRFVHADAIAFCHVLRHRRVHGASTSANFYRNSWEFSLLTLDSVDYAERASAPMLFNVIDTSNLMDHLGILNVMAAAGPLLMQEHVLPAYSVPDSQGGQCRSFSKSLTVWRSDHPCYAFRTESCPALVKYDRDVACTGIGVEGYEARRVVH